MIKRDRDRRVRLNREFASGDLNGFGDDILGSELGLG